MFPSIVPPALTGKLPLTTSFYGSLENVMATYIVLFTSVVIESINKQQQIN